MHRNVTAAEKSLDWLFVVLGLVGVVVGLALVIMAGLWPVPLLPAFVFLGGGLLLATGLLGVTGQNATAGMLLVALELLAAVIAVILVLALGIL